MVFIGMLIAGIIGFVIGEGISRAIRKDPTTRGDESSMTWVIKIIVAGILMVLVYAGCD